MRVASNKGSAAIDWRKVALLGIDVGFSKTSKSTGIAIYAQGHLTTLTCIGSSPHDRAQAIPADLMFDVVAIDGPIVMDAVPPQARLCEALLSRSKFGRRCKPGLSHFGFGLPLREAATGIANEMAARTSFSPRAIVEAFPNAFLGVLLDDEDYAALGRVKRGKKSDAYYARVAATGRFETVMNHLGWPDSPLLKVFQDNAIGSTRAAHEHRAALVCVLTAACALNGTAEYVGDDAGGYICLPPKQLWSNWAQDALLANTS